MLGNLKTTSNNFFWNKYIGYVLFFIFLFIGFQIYDNYGISWDDPMQRTIGEVNYNYVFKGDETLKTFNERDYGVAFELPLIIIEKALNMKDTRNIYLMRHLVTHLFFLIGAFFLFLLIKKLYRNSLLASIGFLLLVLNPLIYSHSFFNTKDIPFLSMFIICFYLLVVAFKIKKLLTFVFLGVACGLLTNLRIMGILLVLLINAFLIYDVFFAKENKKVRTRNLLYIFFLNCFFLLVLYATWPYLWTNPFSNFFTAFKNMSLFRQEVPVLFLGKITPAPQLSQTYSIIWFLISTPLLHLLFGFFGMALLLFRFLKKPLWFLRDEIPLNNLIYFACFLVPIAAVIIFKSVLYDGWRQLYFIYPSFILLIVYGLEFLLKTKAKHAVIMLFFLGFIFLSIFMIKNHPFQYTYFNQIMFSKHENHFRKNFEMDYWGISYKNSLEYILANDTSSILRINVANYSGIINGLILKPEQKNRIRFVEEKDADYFISNYRWHPDDYSYPVSKKYHSIIVLNNTINSVYKLR